MGVYALFVPFGVALVWGAALNWRRVAPALERIRRRQRAVEAPEEGSPPLEEGVGIPTVERRNPDGFGGAASYGGKPRGIRKAGPAGAAAPRKLAEAADRRNFFYPAVFAAVGVFVGLAFYTHAALDAPSGYLIGVGVGFALALVCDVVGGRAERAAAAWLARHGDVVTGESLARFFVEGGPPSPEFEARVEAERRIREDVADLAVAALDPTARVVFVDGEGPEHWQVTGALSRELPGNEGGYVVDAEEWAAYEARVRARILGIPAAAIPSGVWVDWRTLSLDDRKRYRLGFDVVVTAPPDEG